MAKRVGSYYEVELYERHVSHAVAQMGFGRKDTIKAMREHGRGIVPRFSPADVGLGAVGVAELPTVSSLNLGGRATAIATPLPDFSQAAQLDARFYSFHGGSWVTLTASSGEKIMYQYDGSPQLTALRTAWTFPPNPVICVGLWRAEVNGAWLEGGGAWPLTTQIMFGGTFGHPDAQFTLHIPYGGRGLALLAYNRWRRLWEPLEPIEGSTALPSWEGLADGTRIMIWIAAFRNRLWVSADGFSGQVVGYAIPSRFADAEGKWHRPWYGTHVFSGPVWVRHTAGQWAATVFPVWMPHRGAGLECSVQSEPYEFGYRVDENPNPVRWDVWRDTVTDNPAAEGAPGRLLRDLQVEVVATGPTSRAWRAFWEPLAWETELAAGTVRTYVSPALSGVQMSQQANVVGTGVEPASELVADIAEIDLRWPGVGKPACGRVVFEESGSSRRQLRDYQRVKVRAGSLLDDGSNDGALIFAGYVITPGASREPGAAAQAEAWVYDGAIRLSDMRTPGSEPDFAPMTADEALRWLLARCGVGDEQIAGSGSKQPLLEEYDPEDDKWLPQFGRTYAQILREVLAHDGQSVVYLAYDEDAWEIYTRTNGPFNGEAAEYEIQEGSGGQADVLALYAVERDRHGASAEQYANAVYVRGRGRDGAALTGWAVDADLSSMDPASDDFAGGWWHVLCLARDTAQTPEQALQVATALRDEHNRVAETATVVTDMIPAVRYGEVFRVTGPEGGKAQQAGVVGRRYRITGYRHRLRRGRLPQTTLVGRWIGDDR